MKTLLTALAVWVALFAQSAVALWSFQGPDAGEIRDRLDAYLIAYEPKLSELVAEEEMSQRAEYDGLHAPARSRNFVSEVAFISLPGKVGWLGFRRITKINNRPLRDPGPPLAQLLTGGDDEQDQARLLLDQSASFNLGAPRTTNLPNLPLELLHPRHRHRFEQRLDGSERIRNIATTRLQLSERSSPTIIQHPDGSDLKSNVTAWIETANGRLIRAEVKNRDGFETVVWVDFRMDSALGLLVPYEMRESFLAAMPVVPGTAVARYTKYRRFQTSARVVPPP